MYEDKGVPLWKKYSLSIREAAEYYGIGEKKLRSIAYENRGEDFVLEIGSHLRVKRKLFERFLDNTTSL
ncbi:MAG: helix-turn-helix domain-containing protein [Lachnospiraceae bacterium]|nr:helix-turn-helix domain-containing protein [Lachnospiraceae bacterium]